MNRNAADNGGASVSVLGELLLRLIRLFVIVVLCAITAQQGLAQNADEEGRTVLIGQIQGGLIDKALIERERARPVVPDDFADNMLTYANRRINHSLELADQRRQGASIRREAQAGANRIITAQPRTDFLRLFPDPQQVKNDMAAEFGDISDVALAGRQAGRMAMLANALKGLQGVTDTARLPPDVAQMRQRYFLYFYDLRDRMEPTYTDTCPRWQFWCKTRRQTFHSAEAEYEHGIAPAQEVATRYFPASFRDRFIDATGRGGSRQAYSAEEARKNAERAEQSRREWVETLTPVVVLLWLAFLLGIFVLIVWAWAWVNGGEKSDGRPPLTDNHGSAEWGAMNMNVHPLDPLRGVFLGKYAWPSHADGKVKTPPIFTKPEAHTLIMAPTRTGKGTRIIVPTLLRYSGSLLVIDPKGENAAIAGRQRTSIGPVHILNPWGVLDDELTARSLPTSRFNPLDVVRRGDIDAASIAHTMAESICVRSEGKDSAYWEGNATAILTAVLLWLADRDGETKTLARVRQIVTLPLDRIQKEFFVPMSASTAFGGAIAENIGPFVTVDDSRDLPAIMRTLAEATRFISDERLKAATAVSDFDLRTLPHRPETVFLVIPPDKMKAQATWLRLMLAAFTHAFRTAKPRWQTRGMMLIDELPALGKIPDLPNDLATMSGYGLDYTLIVQDMGQLKAIYGEQSRTILANCGWKWLCNVRDYDTAKYVSDTLGQQTVGTETINEGVSGQGDATHGKAYGEMGRPLLTPDEVMQLGRDRAIVLPPAGRPYQAWGVDYWVILDEFQPYREGGMRAYYEQPLVIDPNPYRQEDQD